MGQNALSKAVRPVLVALILLAFGSGVWLLNDGFELERIYEQKSEAKAIGYADRSRAAIERRCRPLAPDEELQCIREENKTAREGAHNAYELEAQFITSIWTRQMGVAAIIAMAFGILGVGLVFVTFHATREANEIARDAQRAWVRLSMEPQEVSPMGDGLYFRVEFYAENIGETVATHFNNEREIFFIAPNEDPAVIVNKITEQLATWKSEYDTAQRACLLPKATEGQSFWDDRQPPDLVWWKGNPPFSLDSVQPVFLAAAFYRTVTHPEAIQMTWRSWYLCTFDTDGQKSSLIPKQTLGPDKLCIDQHVHTALHVEY